MKERQKKLLEFVNKNLGIKADKLSPADIEKLAEFVIISMEVEGMTAIPKRYREELNLPKKN